ncbi:dipeptidase [Mucilaginibacter ginsenosidivorax]|uniref:Peptidase M19 n=1 Tax=Mucilaginibacter ginsenosidivorax TaxID=862126 RepID=A0A5B8W2D7_9SPHI|nr:membrane dipeptidase [Mucilaginibacter ginsenosidivorax]QEC78230.1 peptidase M19 [Mucilaginibacter ginsenosidivorax]
MKKFQPTWSRREFLAAVTLAGAGTAIMLNPLAAWAIDEVDPRVAKIVADTLGIDTHNHIDVPLTAAEVPGPDINLAGEMKKSGLAAICMTFAVDYQKLQNPGDAYERFKNGLASMNRQLARNGMKRSLNMADLNTAHKKHQPTVIQSVEGGHFLEGRIERLEEAYNRGLRHLTLLHDSDASVPLGDVFTNPARWGGLTTFGADVIRECNRLGILVDLGHASAETVAAALKVAKHPVIISHTGLDTQLGQNENMARMMRPRLISKDQAKIVADTGGVIGVWTHLAGSALEYAQNIRALVDVVGIDHVCIGTDTKLTPAYRPAGAAFGPKPGEPGPPPGGMPGNRPDGPPPGDKPRDGANGGPNGGKIDGGTNQTWPDQNTGFYYTVVEAMLNTGFNADEIGKIGGGNFCRVFDAATAGNR